jgi:hypothetical protein
LFLLLLLLLFLLLLLIVLLLLLLLLIVLLVRRRVLLMRLVSLVRWMHVASMVALDHVRIHGHVGGAVDIASRHLGTHSRQLLPPMRLHLTLATLRDAHGPGPERHQVVSAHRGTASRPRAAAGSSRRLAVPCNVPAPLACRYDTSGTYLLIRSPWFD